MRERRGKRCKFVRNVYEVFKQQSSSATQEIILKQRTRIYEEYH